MALAIKSRPPKDMVSPEARFAVLGGALQEIADMPAGDFVCFLHNAWSKGTVAYAGILEDLLVRHERTPKAWAKDVDIHLENIDEMLREPSYLFGERGCGLSVDQVRNHVAKYGRLLAAWPDIHAAAKQFFQNT